MATMKRINTIRWQRMMAVWGRRGYIEGKKMYRHMEDMDTPREEAHTWKGMV